MKIVVIGGSGLIGTNLVTRLRQKGHEVVPASPKFGGQHHHGRGTGRSAGRRTGGRRRGEFAVVRSKAVLEFFETSGRNLLAAEAIAGVEHHVALSVVGADRLPDSGYFRAKLAQEKLIKASEDPLYDPARHAVLRVRGRDRPVGDRRHSHSPVTGSVPADRVAMMWLRRWPMLPRAPVNGIVEVAGPERCRSTNRPAVSGRQRDTRQVVADVHARYFGAEINDHP